MIVLEWGPGGLVVGTLALAIIFGSGVAMTLSMLIMKWRGWNNQGKAKP